MRRLHQQKQAWSVYACVCDVFSHIVAALRFFASRRCFLTRRLCPACSCADYAECNTYLDNGFTASERPAQLRNGGGVGWGRNEACKWMVASGCPSKGIRLGSGDQAGTRGCIRKGLRWVGGRRGRCEVLPRHVSGVCGRLAVALCKECPASGRQGYDDEQQPQGHQLYN